MKIIEDEEILSPQNIRMMEFEILRLLEFRIGGDEQIVEKITISISKLGYEYSINEDVKSKINEASLYFAFLLKINKSD